MTKFYKNDDLETAIDRVLSDMLNSNNQDYLAVKYYSGLIQEIITSVKNDAIDDLQKIIDKQAENLEDLTDSCISLRTDIYDMRTVVCGMRKSETKDKLEQIIERMELTIC